MKSTATNPHRKAVTDTSSSIDGAFDGAGNARWDHSTHSEFFDYYSKESQTEQAEQRFRGVRDAILRTTGSTRGDRKRLDMIDVGCGAGTQCMMWAELGHAAHGLDVNEALLNLGRERAAKAGLDVEYTVGSATNLPWPEASADVVIALELLEHVAPWRRCLDEFVRVLRPGGVMFVTTTNVLCPYQSEFNLPLYSWYPAPLKRYYERLASTTRPALANYAKYPAVNWFTYYGLEKILAPQGFRCLDRFDIMDAEGKGGAAKAVLGAVRALPPLRFAAQVCTAGTRILAIKSPMRS
jgi:2-polyprenyl-6-hydroxyphenyl methylase/3-demethylubiquinone-9 3-methyltransferase